MDAGHASSSIDKGGMGSSEGVERVGEHEAEEVNISRQKQGEQRVGGLVLYIGIILQSPGVTISLN